MPAVVSCSGRADRYPEKLVPAACRKPGIAAGVEGVMEERAAAGTKAVDVAGGAGCRLVGAAGLSGVSGE